MNDKNSAYVVYNITQDCYADIDLHSGGYAYMTIFIYARLMVSLVQAESFRDQCIKQLKGDEFVVRKVTVEV